VKKTRSFNNQCQPFDDSLWSLRTACRSIIASTEVLCASVVAMLAWVTRLSLGLFLLLGEVWPLFLLLGEVAFGFLLLGEVPSCLHQVSVVRSFTKCRRSCPSTLKLPRRLPRSPLLPFVANSSCTAQRKFRLTHRGVK